MGTIADGHIDSIRTKIHRNYYYVIFYFQISMERAIKHKKEEKKRKK